MNWQIEPQLQVSESDLETLRERYPNINSPQDLSKLLVSIAYKVPTSELYGEKSNDRWMIKGSPASTLVAIDFEMAPLSLISSLRAATSSWIGQVHSFDLVKRVEHDVTAFLKRSGYRLASASVKSTESLSRTEYVVTLDIGVPCIVAGYIWPESLPTKINMELQTGDICDETAAQSSVEGVEASLKELGWAEAKLKFEGFVTRQGDSIGYVKVSGSFGSKLIYEFVDSQNGGDVTSLLSSDDRRSLNPNIISVDTAPYEMAHLLKKRGYLDVQVSAPEVVAPSPGNLAYKFTVTTGTQYLLVKLSIEGNEYFDQSEIINTLKLDFNTSTTRDSIATPFNEDAISEGIDSLQAKYVKAGFWDAKIVDKVSQVSSTEKNQMQLVVVIDEGKQRLFDKLEISGNQIVPTAELADYFDVDQGKYFDRSRALDLQQSIRTHYANLGYFYTTVVTDLIATSTSSVDIKLTLQVTIEEGPRVKFGDVFVNGLIKTRSYVVTRELLFKTGDWYDPELVAASRNALLHLGIFSSVVITYADPYALLEKSPMLDIRIDIKEAPSRTLGFGPGWSSFYGMRYNFEGALTNLGGTGRQVFSKASFNQEKSQYAIGPRTLIGRSISTGYLEPHLLDYPIDGKVSVNQAAFASDYAWSLSRGGEFEFSHTLRTLVPGSRIAYFIGRKLSEEESSASAKDAFLADTYSSGHTGLRMTIDKRDDLTWPTKGFTLTSELAWARYELGGDLRYFRWDITNNHYYSFFDDLVFAFSAQVTSYQGITRKNEDSLDILPASERLTAGGVETIRGFPERSLGPIVRRPNINESGVRSDCGFTASTTGGTRRTILKGETRYRWTPSFATTLFVDSGNSSFSAQEMKKFEKAFADRIVTDDTLVCDEPARRSIEDNIGYEVPELLSNPEYIWDRHFTSAGLSLNFLTPIGSINLAYGVPWHEPKTEKCRTNSRLCYSRSPQNVIWWKRGDFHFNVGAKF